LSYNSTKEKSLQVEIVEILRSACALLTLKTVVALPEQPFQEQEQQYRAEGDDHNSFGSESSDGTILAKQFNVANDPVPSEEECGRERD
jgi:hypothetical protein